MKSISNERPDILQDLGDGSFHFNYNIKEVETITEEGVIHKSFNYDTVHVNNNNYDTIVSAMIREKYSSEEEFAIQRQRDTKPDEFKAYFDYCEQCKLIAKG